MKFKKLLTFSLALTVLAGCGGNKADTSKASNDENQKIVDDLKGEKVEITFWHGMSKEQEVALTDITNDFMKKYPNIKVNLQNQSNYKDLQSKITTAMASPDSLPNITQAYADWMIKPIEQKLVLDLKPYMDNSKLKYDNYEDIVKSFRQVTEQNGKIYGLPFNKSTDVLFYNKKIFNKLGLKVPTTYEEYQKTCKTIYDKEGVIGGGFDSLNNFYDNYLRSAGIVINDKLDPTCEASMNAAKYLKDGVDSKAFRIPGSDQHLSTPFTNGQVASFIGSSAGLSFVEKGAPKGFEFGIAPYPANKDIQQGTDLFVFNKTNAKENTASYLYLKYLTSKDVQIEWANRTGYIPVRNSAINDKAYQNSGSLLPQVIKESTKKFYLNEIAPGNDAAFKESRVVLEKVVSSPKKDIKKIMEDYNDKLKQIYREK